jgi:thiamine pyrophosphokinase
LSNLTRALIFGNGEMGDIAATRDFIHPNDIVIAADGGAQYCIQLGITPDVLIGDFDSIDAEVLAECQRAGTQIIQHPARKDFTDLELALQYARSIEVGEILVLGALGARWDQTLANLLIAAADSFRDVKIRLIDGEQEILLIRERMAHNIHGHPGDIVSLIPLNDRVQGVSTIGLEYALQDEPLLFGGTRGVSNVLTDKSATITIRKGTLLCVIIHEKKQKQP